MKPINPDVLYKELSEELKYSKEDIENIVDTYYMMIARKIREGATIKIRIAKFGEFSILRGKLNNKIEKLESQLLACQKNKTMRQFATNKNITSQLENLYEAKAKIAEEVEIRQIKRKERKEYVTNKIMEGKR